jgi:membrane protease YdiL (CAAX protease family)
MPEHLLSQENHLFNLARSGQLRWPKSVEKLYPLAALLYGALVPFVAQLLVIIPILLLLTLSANPQFPDTILPDFNPDAGMSLQLVLAFTPIYFLVWAWLWIFERRHLWTIGLEWPGWLRKYLRGLLVGLLLFSSSVGIMALLGDAALDPTDTTPPNLAILGGALIVFAGWIVQGAAEEVLTTGFLLPVVGTRWGTRAGILLSSIIFALFHLFNPHLSIIALLNLFLFGVFTALYALQEGSMWGICAIHSIWNWAQGNLYGFEVSGQEFESSIIWNLMEVGPDWLTGGSFGPEGGLIVTGVLIVACAGVWLISRKPVAPQARDAGR